MNWCVIGMPNRVAVPVTLMRCHTALYHYTALRQHEFSGQVIVPYLGRYLFVTLFRVHSIGVIIISWVWVQVFSWEILRQSRRPKVMLN
jgi:hypothetical protein